MYEDTDNPPSLYKDIRLSDITRKFQFPFSFPHSSSSSSLEPPPYLLPQSQQLKNCHNEIQYLRGEVIRLSSLEIQFSAYRKDYQNLENKYEQMLNQNIRIHALLKGGGELENELTEANSKISSLMRQNQYLHKLQSVEKKQQLRIKMELQNSQRKGFVLEGQYQIVLTEKIQMEQLIDEQRREKQLLLGKYDKELQDMKNKMHENEVKFRGQRYNIEALQGSKFSLEKDVKRMKQQIKTLEQVVKEKNQQIEDIEAKIKQSQKDKMKIESLKKDIKAKNDSLDELQNKNDVLNEINQKLQKQIKELGSNYSLKFNTIVNQNKQLKSSLQSLQLINNTSLINIQTLESQIFQLQNSSSKLELENTKLSSALYTSKAQCQQNRRKSTQLSRMTCDAEHYKGENQRLKQQLLLVKKKHKQIQHNYESLLKHMKERDRNDVENTNDKPRQSCQSRKSTRSSKSKQPRHAQITLTTSRSRSSNKSFTELQQLSNVDQYKSAIESKLLKNSLNKNETLNENVMRRYKIFFNK